MEQGKHDWQTGIKIDVPEQRIPPLVFFLHNIQTIGLVIRGETLQTSW
jgi:hypothetical protein